MFVVTNRALHPKKTGLAQFGDEPNGQGPNELRIVEASRSGPKRWQVEVLPDTLTTAMKNEVGIQESGTVYCSEYVAKKLRNRVRRHILLSVHGFNNDMEDVLEQAHALQSTYGVEVIAFSWPARGGGAVSGTLSYKRDKQAALVSVGALDRTVEKLHGFVSRFNAEALEQVRREAHESHGTNACARDVAIAEQSDRRCPFRVSAVFHSMGNYLFKHALLSSSYASRLSGFDNVVLVAADTNSAEHAAWVDRINVRKRVYVAINEDDYALRASRMKLGDEQRARLGHSLVGLSSQQAVYVDFTGLESVGNSHSYHVSAKRDTDVRRFFRSAFRGDAAEPELWYHASENVYRFWPGG